MSITHVYANVARTIKPQGTQVASPIAPDVQSQPQSKTTFSDELKTLTSALDQHVVTPGKHMESETTKQIYGTGSIELTAERLAEARVQLELTSKALTAFTDKFNELTSRFQM